MFSCYRKLAVIAIAAFVLTWPALSPAYQVGESAKSPQSFRAVKKALRQAYKNAPAINKTFYCGCPIGYDKKGYARPNAFACGYRPRIDSERARRIEWEHVVPAWEFGHQLRCWQEGKEHGTSGRKWCRKQSARFNRMEADPHNLVPAIGELNRDRSYYRYADLPGPADQYGLCDFKVDFKGRKARPREEIRGDIARTYFYMRDTYGLTIGKKQLRLYEQWNREDPVDRVECAREAVNARISGRSNPHVANNCSSSR